MLKVQRRLGVWQHSQNLCHVIIFLILKRYFELKFSTICFSSVPLTTAKTDHILCCKNKECMSVRTFKLDPLTKFL